MFMHHHQDAPGHPDRGKRRQVRRPRFRPAVAALEERQLLAGDVTVNLSGVNS
ncbi:MAG: hypothetical protein JOZ53_04630, partial [Planctomycetaceae bacterium]|nr:hypothetical protein [Planctomycetaceae bacterium]